MSDSSVLEEPLFSQEQAVWLILALVWFITGGVSLLTEELLPGTIWLIASIVAAYNIYKKR